MKPFQIRLLIGIDTGSDVLEFFSHDGNLLATGYTRVVIGKRGPYVEFEHKHINWTNFVIPPGEQYREHSNVVFYVEYRSVDTRNVKLYLQRRRVSYADYKIDMCYISPFDLLRTDMQPVII